MDGNRRWIVLAVGIAALVVLFLLLRPGGSEPDRAGSTSSPTAGATDSSSPSPTEDASPSPKPTLAGLAAEFEVEDGRVTGPNQIEVQQGLKVVILVKADVADEVHLHGYDIKRDVRPGKPAVLRFTADAAGVFEIELEEAALLLTRLKVSP